MDCVCAVGRNEKPAILLQNLTYLKSTSRRYAHEYYRLGMHYHRLPLHVRNHEKVPTSWQTYCETAFTVSANRELPDLIQVFTMVESSLEGAHFAIFKGEVNAAEHQLFVAHKLSQEAEDRGQRLQYAAVQYERLLKVTTAMGESIVNDRDKDEAMEEAWKMALPKCVSRSLSSVVSDIRFERANPHPKHPQV